MQLSHIEQSENWARFQSSIPTRGKFYKIGKTFIYRHSLPLGYSWLNCPRGKLSAQNLKQLKKIAAKEKSIFLRLEPPQSFKFPKKFHKAHKSYQPEETLVLDLTLSEKELLAQMKPKGRYNIKLAQKKGIKITRASDPKQVEIFYELLQKTVRRDNFHAHPFSYYEKLLKTLKGDNLKRGSAKLFIAEHENEPIAALIATFYKNTATYYFGASSNSHRDLMAPYLLQWEAIRHAKNLHMHYYDFLGIAPAQTARAKSHPWQGVTEFKLKFGGTRVKYPRAREFIFNRPLYYALILIKKLRSLRDIVKALASRQPNPPEA